MNSMHSRRGFLKGLSGAALGLASVSAFGAQVPFSVAAERKLSFYNLHTGESLTETYWVDGHYIPEVMAGMNHLLRDHRTDTSIEIDPRLFDMLFLLQQDLGVQKQFHVISGYRSPKTNEQLRKNNSKVAKRSYHMLGKAIDIRVPGVPLKTLGSQARSMKVGGVGLYQRSDFVHVDVGPVRTWGKA